MEIAETIKKIMQEVIVPELGKIKEENHKIVAILELTNKRLGEKLKARYEFITDVHNLKVVPHAKCTDSINWNIFISLPCLIRYRFARKSLVIG